MDLCWKSTHDALNSLCRPLTSVWICFSRCCVVCVEWEAWCLWFVWGMISAALNNDRYVRPDVFKRASRYDDQHLTGLMHCDQVTILSAFKIKDRNVRMGQRRWDGRHVVCVCLSDLHCRQLRGCS